MIFTECIENNIIFNEADSKNKLTMDRAGLLRKTTRLVKEELGSTIAKHTTYRTDKDYSRDGFINNKCEFVTVAHIKKSAESYIGTQAENAKAILDVLIKTCEMVNRKMPSECKVVPKYKGNPNSDEWDGWDISLTVPAGKTEFLTESYAGGGNMNNDVLVLSGNNGGSYIQDALYESYIQAKIDAEDRLALALKESMVISESDYSNIRAIREASLGDKIKVRWHKFIAFIKNMFARFMESMTNLFYNDKKYLEKYKDIILNKKPKDSMKYSYTGDYNNGTKRILGTTIPIFSYTNYKTELEAEGDGPLANKLVSGFNYVDGEALASQYKSYFLDLDKGTQSGTFDQLNMTTIYNFCYDFQNIKNVLDKNKNNLDASTRAIETEINNQIKAASESVISMHEADEAEKKEDTTGKTTAPSKGIQITDRDEKVKDQEKQNATQDAETAKKENKDDTFITNAANKWIDVVRAIISAQLTACQQIYKDYMSIIRAHVRSYVGNSKNKDDNATAKKADTYEKSDALKKAEKQSQEAEDIYSDSSKIPK